MTDKSKGKQRVFISHSMKDADWARSFATALEQRGLSVWLDELHLQSAESWHDALEAGLRGSNVFVTLLDPDPSSQPSLFFELGAAIGMGKVVVSIVPKNTTPGALPTNIRSSRYVTRDTPEQTAEELSSMLRAA